jgi:hypothetical protein
VSLRIRWNDRKVDEYLQRASLDDRKRAAERAASAVRTAAPSSEADEIHVEVEADNVYVVNRKAFWHIIEYGSIKSRAYAPLRRGVERVMGYKPTPK